VATISGTAGNAADGSVAPYAAISGGCRGLIQGSSDRLRAACVGGYRLSVAAWQAAIAWIDAICAGCAVIALDSHNLRADRRGATYHSGGQRHAGHQCARQV
jgi:hypothetical protein